VLASGGPEQQDHALTVDTVLLHIRTMLSALDRLERHGYSFGERKVQVLATTARQLLGDRIAENLGGIAGRGQLDHAYYSGGLRHQIWVSPPDGRATPLIDGGVLTGSRASLRTVARYTWLLRHRGGPDRAQPSSLDSRQYRLITWQLRRNNGT
jgi:hypothetical protein